MKFTNLTGKKISIVDTKSKQIKMYHIEASNKFILIENSEYIPVTKINSMQISRLKNTNEITVSIVYDDGKLETNVSPSKLNTIFPKLEDHYYIVGYEYTRLFAHRKDVLYPSEPYKHLNKSKGKIETEEGKYLSLCQNPFC